MALTPRESDLLIMTLEVEQIILNFFDTLIDSHALCHYVFQPTEQRCLQPQWKVRKKDEHNQKSAP